jgi:hypothetical protein
VAPELSASPRRCTAHAVAVGGFYAAAVVIAASFAYELFQLPVQVSDSLQDILYARESQSLLSAFYDGERTHFRPLRDTQIKALLDSSGGHYHLAYRGFHSGLFLLASWLFLRSLQATTATDKAAALLAFTVFIGSHTLTGTVASAYPINHFLEIVVLTLLAFNIAQGPPGRRSFVALLVVFITATLVLETGLLVCVIAVSAWWAGYPGVTKRSALVLTACTLAYLAFSVSRGYTTLIPDGAGFWLEVLEPGDVARMLADNPLPYYAYNIASSILTVLFAEPRRGVFVAVRDWGQGELLPRAVIPIVTSTVTTLLIASTAWRLRKTLVSSQSGRVMVVFAVVLLANASMSYAYTKDEIMSVAGSFYAIAAYVAIRERLASVSATRFVGAALVIVPLAVVSVGWSVRVQSLHHTIYIKAFKDRNDWASLAVPANGGGGAELTRKLRAEVMADRRSPNPRFVPVWVRRWLEEGS